MEICEKCALDFGKSVVMGKIQRFLVPEIIKRAAACGGSPGLVKYQSSLLASAIILVWFCLGTSSYRSKVRVKEPLAWVIARRSMA